MKAPTTLPQNWIMSENSKEMASIVAFQSGAYIKSVGVTFDKAVDLSNIIVSAEPMLNGGAANVNIVAGVLRNKDVTGTAGAEQFTVRIVNFGGSATGTFTIRVRVLYKEPLTITLTT